MKVASSVHRVDWISRRRQHWCARMADFVVVAACLVVPWRMLLVILLVMIDTIGVQSCTGRWAADVDIDAVEWDRRRRRRRRRMWRQGPSRTDTCSIGERRVIGHVIRLGFNNTVEIVTSTSLNASLDNRGIVCALCFWFALMLLLMLLLVLLLLVLLKQLGQLANVDGSVTQSLHFAQLALMMLLLLLLLLLIMIAWCRKNRRWRRWRWWWRSRRAWRIVVQCVAVRRGEELGGYVLAQHLEAAVYVAHAVAFACVALCRADLDLLATADALRSCGCCSCLMWATVEVDVTEWSTLLLRALIVVVEMVVGGDEIVCLWQMIGGSVYLAVGSHRKCWSTRSGWRRTWRCVRCPRLAARVVHILRRPVATRGRHRLQAVVLMLMLMVHVGVWRRIHFVYMCWFQIAKWLNKREKKWGADC